MSIFARMAAPPLLVALAACASAGPPLAAAYPTDYVGVASRSVQRSDTARYEVSEPRQMPDWSMGRGARWYVCVRRDGGTPDLLLISTSGRAETRIADTDLQFCGGATYQAFKPAPNAIAVPVSRGPKVPVRPTVETTVDPTLPNLADPAVPQG